MVQENPYMIFCTGKCSIIRDGLLIYYKNVLVYNNIIRQAK